MRPPRLSTLLIALNVSLLLLAVGSLAVTAGRLLGQLGDEQALARAAQAGSSAANAVDLAGQDIAMEAQLLAERPTLARLAQAGDADGLASFLAQFQATSRLDGTALLQGGQVVAQSGSPLDWAALWSAYGTLPRYFVHAGAGAALLLGAAAPTEALPGGGVLVVVSLDEAFAARLGSEVGLPVVIVDRAAALAAGSAFAARSRALEQAQPVSTRVAQPDRYLSVIPLKTPGGAVAGLIETTLPASAVTGPVRELIQSLLLLAIGAASLAGLLNLWLGRRLGRPLLALTEAAGRIGAGDLSTPLPGAPRQAPAWHGAEITTLAAALEDMRRHLLQLTAHLERQQAESQAILTGIVEGVFAVDRERRIRYLNPQAAGLLGIDAQAALGRFCGDVLDPVGPDGARPCAEHCPILHARFRGGARATEHLQLPTGQRRTVVITSAPPADHPAADSGLRQLQVIRDETEVEATRRLRDAVLANISHEFKTPLSAQLASIELLLNQLPDLTLDQTAGLVRSLQRGALRLTQLIDNLLESVRVEAGQSGIRRQAVALDEVLEHALELTQPLLDQRQQTVEVELPYPYPPVCGDAPRLAQVLVNLLANANKYAPAGATIRVGGAVAGSSVRLWVEDPGPGLPDVPESRLFARFIRSTAAEPEQGGVGLGLYIVKSIVERHGGQVVAARSERGTRMEVRLPRMEADENPGG